MADSTVFTNNRTQAVRLPAETRFPDTVKKVALRWWAWSASWRP